MTKQKVIVGMSGGVDSSVAAALLIEQGYEVEGLFMKNWEERNDDGTCTATQDFDDALKVSEKLGIQCKLINFSKEYWQNVFQEFINDYNKGLTPNPDILCNREIKFKVFLNEALNQGADFVATGHYCQTERKEGNTYLKKGLDQNKDQTYFLHAITEAALSKTLFPIGHLEKSEVRKIAERYQLTTSQKKDSTGVCFIGERNFNKFLSQYIHTKPGKMKTLDGTELGEHNGLCFYTVGQRRGLGLGGPGEPWFVVDRDIKENIIYVERGLKHSALFSETLIANDITWINPSTEKIVKDSLPLECKAKVRYRQEDQDCIIESYENGELHVSFPIPQRAVAEGQYISFYDNDICLGGARIIERGESFYHQKRDLPEIVAR